MDVCIIEKNCSLKLEDMRRKNNINYFEDVCNFLPPSYTSAMQRDKRK